MTPTRGDGPKCDGLSVNYLLAQGYFAFFAVVFALD
jgi:hypothetical protein